MADGRVFMLLASTWVRAWPNYLLHHGCAKGQELLASGDPPPIMGAIPILDPTILSLTHRDGSEVGTGMDVTIDSSLILTHNGTKGPHGFQTVCFPVECPLTRANRRFWEGGRKHPFARRAHPCPLDAQQVQTRAC